MENGTPHGKRNEVTPLFEKKNIHSLHTSTHDFVFGPPRKRLEEEEARKLATFIHPSHLRQQFPGASNVTFSASFLLNVFVIVDVGTNVTTT